MRWRRGGADGCLNIWGTFLLFTINLCRAGDLLEYLFLLSTDTKGGDGVALVAHECGWWRRRGPVALWGFSNEIPWLWPEHSRDLGDERKHCWCLTFAGIGKCLHSCSTRSSCIFAGERTKPIDLATCKITQERCEGRFVF